MKYADRLFNAFMYPLEAVALNRRRRELMKTVSGKVLEIGAGTGANFRFYPWKRVEQLHMSDLSLTESVRSLRGTDGDAVHHHEADVQNLPFDDGTFDSVVFTLVFCSVPEPERGLAEVHRVLKPGGTLVFIEHVRPERGVLRRAVDALNPAWRAFTGECNINRDTLASIRAAGFIVDTVRYGGRGLLIDGVAHRP